MQIRAARNGDEDGIAHLHVHSWQSTYQGIVPDETLKNISVEERRQQWVEAMQDCAQQPKKKAIFVAEQGGRIIGFVCGGEARRDKLKNPADYDAELYAIYVEAGVQGQGIGQALFAIFRDWLVQHGFRHMILWAFADNPFLKFYPKLGGLLGHEARVNNSLGTPLKIISFVWRDLGESEKKYG